MLSTCVGISNYNRFRDLFRQTHSDKEWVDLSDVDTRLLIEHCEAIINHHTNSCVFLGFLEPGWMLEHVDQTRLRELFRAFPVGFVCQFEDSIPFSWKNETEMLYLPNRHNGQSNSIDHGCAVHYQPEVQHV